MYNSLGREGRSECGREERGTAQRPGQTRRRGQRMPCLNQVHSSQIRPLVRVLPALADFLVASTGFFIAVSRLSVGIPVIIPPSSPSSCPPDDMILSAAPCLRPPA
jgi:hypothetical protein